jgi:glycine/D-amino acid oxidase-like deaminating enzyme
MRTPWMLEKPQECPPFTKNIKTEVCIVGVGIAGLSVAYQLALMGVKVVVLDSGKIGRGETGRTTAHLTNAFDDRYYKLSSKEERQLIAQSHTHAINYLEQIITKEKIECEFTRLEGYLFLGETDPISLLEIRIKVYARGRVN